MALKQLVDTMTRQSFPCAVHLISGNHDQVSLQERSQSAPALIAHEKADIHAYTEVEKRYVDGVPIVYLPWYEDATELLPHLMEYAAAPDARRTLVLGHIALRGALMTGYNYGNIVGEVTDDTAVLTTAHFESFSHSFFGHFHRHDTRGKCTYVGAPRQTSFSDAQSANRGYVLYHPDTGDWRLVVNPYGADFVDVTPEEVLSGAFDNNELKNKSVRLISLEGTTMHMENEARAALTQCEITSLKVVRRTRPRPKALAENGDASDHAQPVENQRVFLARMANRFVHECMPAALQADALAYISTVIAGTVSETSKTLFHADVAKVTVKDFLGFRGTMTLNFDALARGVWMMTGENGSGKSQLLDAIAWCLFKETFRGVNKEEVTNNEAAAGTQCAVAVTFANGTSIYRTVKSLRVTRPNGAVVQKGSMKHTQEVLEREILNADWDTFRRAVLLDSNDFLSLFSSGDKQRNTVLERLLGMEVLDTMWKAVVADATASGEKEAGLSMELMGIDLKLKLVAREVEEIERRIQGGTVRLRETEAMLQAEHAAVCRDEEAEGAWKQRIVEHRARLISAQKNLGALAPALHDVIERRAQVAAQASRVEHEDARAIKECQNLTAMLATAQEEVASIKRERVEVEKELAFAGRTAEELKRLVEEQKGQGGELRADLQERERALDEARTAVSDHQAETIRLRDELSGEERTEITILNEQRKRVVVARDSQRKAAKADQERRTQLRRTLAEREQVLRARVLVTKDSSESYRARLKLFEETQREAEKISKVVRRRKERLTLPKIIDKANQHAQASKNEAIIKGIRDDVVEPLREMSATVGDVADAVTVDDEERLKHLTERLDTLCIGGDPTYAKLTELEEDVKCAEDAWSCAVKTSSDVATGAEAETSSLDGEVDTIDGRLEELRAAVDVTAARFQTERQREDAVLKATFLSRHGDRRTAAQILVEWEEREDSARRASQEAETVSGQLYLHMEACELKLVAAEGRVADLRDRLRAEEGRRPDEETLLRLRNQAEAGQQELDQLREQDEAARRDQSQASAAIVEAEEALVSLSGRALKRKETMGHLSADVFHARETLNCLVLEQERKQRDHETLQKTRVEVRKLLTQAEDEHEVRELWKNALASANDTTSAKAKTVLQQKGAFRRVCRKEHLSFLQSRFDENLALLNGGNWDTRLASTLTENFQFNKRDGDAIAFNQRSSGERQRTILALLFSILESLITHGNLRPMLLGLDEVVEHLDTDGRQSVYRFLKVFTSRHPTHLVLLVSHMDDSSTRVGTIRAVVEGPARKRKYIAMMANGDPVAFQSEA